MANPIHEFANQILLYIKNTLIPRDKFFSQSECEFVNIYILKLINCMH